MKKILALLLTLVLFMSVSAFAAEELPKDNVEISTTAIGGGKIMHGTENWSLKAGYDVPIGSEFTVNAVETTGKFLYWKDVSTGKIITYNNEYTFNAIESVNVQAVFVTGSGISGNAYVTFTDKDGKVYYSNYVAPGSSAPEPSTGWIVSAGYTFSGWSTDAWKNVKAGDIITVNAVYEKKNKNYTVEVSGGAAIPAKETYGYDSRVTVVANPSEIPEGKCFAGWKMNGQLVSYDDVFSFFVGSNCTLTPVYADEAPKVIPVVAIVDKSKSAVPGNGSILMSRWVPDAFDVLESGIIYADSGFTGEMSIYSGDVKKGVAASKTSSGMYRYNIEMSLGDSKRVVPYIVYKHDDKLYVEYGEEAELIK